MVAPPIEPETLAAATLFRPPYDQQSFERTLEHGVSSSGRTLSPGMPRFDLGSAGIDALWRFLENLPADERRGVTPDVIRLAIPILPSSADEAATRELRVALERAWAALGTPVVNGRRLRFATVPTGETPAAFGGVFAVLAAGHDRDGGDDLLAGLSAHGIPVIGPRRPPRAGEDRWPGVVWLTAGEAAIERILAEEGGGAILVRRPADFDRAARARPGQRVLVSSFAVTAPADIDRLGGTQGDVVLLRPEGDLADPDALAGALVLVLREALAAAGRDLTRTGFLRALAGVRVSPPAWTPLDYGRLPSTGTDAVERLDLSPAARTRGGPN